MTHRLTRDLRFYGFTIPAGTECRELTDAELAAFREEKSHQYPGGPPGCTWADAMLENAHPIFCQGKVRILQRDDFAPR